MATDSTSASREGLRLSSSTSELFGDIYARGGVAPEVSDRSWLQAMLDVEAALARGCEKEGLIPAGAAEAIAAACQATDFDLVELRRETGRHATPVVAIAGSLRERASPHAHHGATSQDIVDTAAMLVARRSLSALMGDAAAASDAAARLAAQHRDTPISGRTLLQQAMPTSFGLVTAGWMTGIDAALARLADVREQVLAVQLGGPVGNGNPAVAAHMATDLGLAEPVLPWHTIRVRPAELAAALGTLAGVLAKAARDVTLLAQTEVGELHEGGEADRGRSSSVPHKRNPVAAVSVLACTERVPGLVATMLGAMAQEHQRAAGALQAEWGTITELLRLTGSAAAWARDLLEGLRVDVERMRSNIAVEGRPGAASALVDRALAAHRE